MFYRRLGLHIGHDTDIHDLVDDICTGVCAPIVTPCPIRRALLCVFLGHDTSISETVDVKALVCGTAHAPHHAKLSLGVVPRDFHACGSQWPPACSNWFTRLNVWRRRHSFTFVSSDNIYIDPRVTYGGDNVISWWL
jgi:hypothetical protein